MKRKGNGEGRVEEGEERRRRNGKLVKREGGWEGRGREKKNV